MAKRQKTRSEQGQRVDKLGKKTFYTDEKTLKERAYRYQTLIELIPDIIFRLSMPRSSIILTATR